jgi:hypothetical protein
MCFFVFGSDYFDVVERPMDLDTIRKWVEEAVYDRPVAARTPHEIVNAAPLPLFLFVSLSKLIAIYPRSWSQHAECAYMQCMLTQYTRVRNRSLQKTSAQCLGTRCCTMAPRVRYTSLQSS